MSPIPWIVQQWFAVLLFGRCMICLCGSQLGGLWAWHPPLSSVCPRWLCWGPFRVLIGALSLCSYYNLAYLLSLGASRGILLSIQLVFLLAPISSPIDHAVSLWRSLCQPWLPRQEFCLGLKLSLSSCDGWLSQYLPYLVFRSLSRVLLQLCWECLQKSSLFVGISSFPELRCMCWPTSPWSVAIVCLCPCFLRQEDLVGLHICFWL